MQTQQTPTESQSVKLRPGNSAKELLALVQETGLADRLRAELFAEWAEGNDWDGIRQKLNLLSQAEKVLRRMAQDE